MNIYAVTALFMKNEKEGASYYLISDVQIATSPEAAKAAVLAEYGQQQIESGYRVEGTTCIHIDDALLTKAGWKRP